MKCPNCGCEVSDTRQICPFCGLVLPVRRPAYDLERTQNVYAGGVEQRQSVPQKGRREKDASGKQRTAIIILLAAVLLVEILHLVILLLP